MYTCYLKKSLKNNTELQGKICSQNYDRVICFDITGKENTLSYLGSDGAYIFKSGTLNVAKS